MRYALYRLPVLLHSLSHSYTCNVLAKSGLFWLPRIDCLSKRGRVTRFFGFILSFQNQTHLGRWLTGKKDLQIIAFSRRYSQNWVDKKKCGKTPGWQTLRAVGLTPCGVKLFCCYRISPINSGPYLLRFSALTYTLRNHKIILVYSGSRFAFDGGLPWICKKYRAKKSIR